MIGRIWGWDTETIQKGKNNTQYPYTFQIYGGPGLSFLCENPTLSPDRFRNEFFKFLDQQALSGDIFVCYNLEFDGLQTFFRDDLSIYGKKIFRRFPFKSKTITITGVLSYPTPFLEMYISDGRKITFIDSSKFFEGMNLEKVALQYKTIPKMKRPSYIGKRFPTDREKPSFFKYAMVDAQVCYELGLIIKKYHELANLNAITFSVAHLAGTNFNINFCDNHKLDYPGQGIDFAALQAKYGGYRASYIQQGVYKRYAHLDVVSLYPYVMSKMKAYFNGKYYQTTRLEREGIYKIQTILPKNETQPLFLKRIKGHKIEFQPLNAVISFWCTEPEITAYKKIHKKWKYKILNGFVWRGQSKNRPLARWVELHFKEKAKYSKNGPEKFKRDFHKDMMNHLTGKFDANIGVTEEKFITKDGEKDFSYKRPGMLRNYFVAAVLRGAARAYTWIKGYNKSVQYMTDSIDIPVKYANSRYFNIGSGLGQWEIEAVGDFIFYRTGLYLYFNWRKNKEPLKNALHGFQSDWRKFLELVRLGGGTYTRTKMMRVKESLKRDGGLTAFKFYDKKFELKNVSKKLTEEIKSWLRNKTL
jgi:hypothetical protein